MQIINNDNKQVYIFRRITHQMPNFSMSTKCKNSLRAQERYSIHGDYQNQT